MKSKSLTPFQVGICGSSGNVAYAVIEYENALDSKGEISSLVGSIRPLCPRWTQRWRIRDCKLLVVEAKRWSRFKLISYDPIPKSVNCIANLL
jgi:hypothetical protein